MARPLSDEKRKAILDAAADVVALHGVSAPTAKIAQRAGVAEGTLFTYFANKDALLNELYLVIKTDLHAATMSGYPSRQSLIDRTRHVWDRYVGWGVRNHLKYKALRQLSVSDRITAEIRQIVGDSFGVFRELMIQCARVGPLKDQPSAFAPAVMGAIAETTMDFIAADPAKAKELTEAGFQAFWRAVAG